MSDFYFDGKTVIYPGVLPGHIAPFLPDAVQLNGSYFAVPHTLRNCIMLRRHEYVVPPIMTDETYDWPIERGRKPMAHQRVYSNFTVMHPRMVNLGDMGTAKTLSTLWAMDFMMQQFAPGTCRALILAPLTILDTVWGAAIFRNLGKRRSFKILTGSEDKRIALLEEPADCYILNFDGMKVGAHLRGPKRGQLDGFSAALAARKDIQIVIVDEASAFKDSTTARHTFTRKAVGDRAFWWGLTGTPTPNAPTDAYGIAKFVNNAFGKSFRSFQMETMVKITDFRWIPKKDGYETARRLLTPAVRFALDEVWDAPPMLFQRRKVELTAEQTKAMTALKNELQVIAKNGNAIPVANEAAARQKLIQISLGMVYDEKHVAHTIDAKPRYEEIYEIISSTQRKVLVFVVITGALHLMVDFLRKKWKADKLPYTCNFINGEVAPKERAKIIRAFETDPEFKVCFADPQAAGHGINEFVAADTVVWASATDKAELFLQGNGRVRRPGQKHPTTCFQIISNKLESEIFDRLENNTSLQGVMLQAIREGKF